MLRPIAEHSDAANYEVPSAFFPAVLGPNRNYSSRFYKTAATTLQEAEEEAPPIRPQVDAGAHVA